MRASPCSSLDFHWPDPACTRDPSSGITKTYPVDAAGVLIPRLQTAAETGVQVQLVDPFTQNVVGVTVRAKNTVDVPLRESALVSLSCLLGGHARLTVSAFSLATHA